MKHTLVIASRELRESTRLLVVGAAMSLLPFVAMIPPDSRLEALAMASAILAVMVGLGIAIMFGVSTIAGELVARRMSFYFSKPVSPAAIWFGKMFAAIVTSVACFAIVVTPGYLVAGNYWRRTIGGPQLFLYVLGAIVVMFLISHALATVVRSHSALIGLDFVFFLVSLGVIFMIARPLLFGGSMLGFLIPGIIGAAIVAALIVVPVRQLAQGRSDIRRSHAAFSRAFWTSIAIVLALAGAYTLWVVSVTPSGLAHIVDVEQAPGGNAIFLTGVGRGRADYHASFLLDLKSGRYERITTAPWWGVRFSQDGSTVAWLQAVSLVNRTASLEIYAKRLDQPDSPIIETGIRQKGWNGSFTLSPDGSRIAVVDALTIAVHEVATRRLLASVPRERPYTNQIYFASRDVVRVHQSQFNTMRMEIFELDIPSKKFAKTGEVDVDRTYMRVDASQDGSRILLTRTGVVADGRTGAIVAKLPITTKSLSATGILSDGTIAVAKTLGPQESRLSLYAPDGTLKHEISLPARSVWISGEVGSKLVAVGRVGDKVNNDTGRGWRTFVIDPSRGTIERTQDDLMGTILGWIEPRLNRFPANAKLAAIDADGKLVTWNPATGEVAPLQ